MKAYHNLETITNYFDVNAENVTRLTEMKLVDGRGRTHTYNKAIDSYFGQFSSTSSDGAAGKPFTKYEVGNSLSAITV